MRKYANHGIAGHSFPRPRRSNISITMEFPHTWEVLQAELMETFTAPDSADITAQLLAQLRPTGRILDGFQLVLGGTRIQEAEVDLGALVPATAFSNYKLRFQFWPRDICIRRNMLSSSWIDAPAHICSNESAVFDETGAEVTPAEFMTRLDEGADYEPEGAAFRWAITVGEDGTLRLQLQGLPAAAVILSGRHQFKGLVQPVGLTRTPSPVPYHMQEPVEGGIPSLSVMSTYFPNETRESG